MSTWNKQTRILFLGIQLQAYSPLGSNPTGELPKPNAPKYSIRDHPDVVAMGEKYGKSAPQVALRYLLQRGIAVVAKSIGTVGNKKVFLEDYGEEANREQIYFRDFDHDPSAHADHDPRLLERRSGATVSFDCSSQSSVIKS